MKDGPKKLYCSGNLLAKTGIKTVLTAGAKDLKKNVEKKVTVRLGFTQIKRTWAVFFWSTCLQFTLMLKNM